MKLMRVLVIVLTGIAAGATVFFAMANPIDWGRVVLSLTVAFAGIFTVALTGDVK